MANHSHSSCQAVAEQQDGKGEGSGVIYLGLNSGTVFLQSHICYLFYWYSVEKAAVTNLYRSCCTRVRAGVHNCPVSQMYSLYLNPPAPVSCLTCCTEREETGRVEVMTVGFFICKSLGG